MRETFQFIGEVCVAWFGAYLMFVSGRMSPGWQLVGFILIVVGGTGLLHHLTEKSPVSDEWFIGKGKDGVICMTRHRQKP